MDGNWEYISGANSLVIDYGTSKVLYRHSYLDDAVLALKKDGAYTDKDGEIFLLANENLIPNADAVSYLENKYFQTSNFRSMKLNNGRMLVINRDDFTVGAPSDVSEDGVYLSADGKSKYLIQKGKLVSTHSKITIDTNVCIWNENGWIPRVGDKVEGANSGEFRSEIEGHNYKIQVENGRVINVIDISFQQGLYLIGALVSVVILIVIITIMAPY
jgi:hypothetical protein